MKKKSRLVAQNYTKKGAATITTKELTVQSFSQRLTLCLAASVEGMLTYTRDVTQAYIQFKTELEREVYIRAPKEPFFPQGQVLRVVKPLYGIPESGINWYLTYP